MPSVQSDDPEEKPKRLVAGDEEADAKLNESKARNVEAKVKPMKQRPKTSAKPKRSRPKPQKQNCRINDIDIEEACRQALHECY